MWEKDVNWYVAFISIVFGVFISVWAEPMAATLKLTILEDGDNNATYLLLARGLLLFLILVCLWWWYAFFLAKVEPAKGFLMFAYDFLSLGAFSLAFSVWESETVFAFTVMIAAGAVMFRFLLAWPKAVEKERTALKFALSVLALFTVFMGVSWGLSSIAGLDIDPKIYQVGIGLFLLMSFVATACAVFCIEGGFRWGEAPESNDLISRDRR